MLFSSIPFIYIFFPIVFLGFWLSTVFKSRVVSLVWLFASSIYFYGYYDSRYIWLLLSSILVNYGLSLVVLANNIKKCKLIFTTIGVIFNIALIGYFKYKNFFLENTNLLLGTDFTIEKLIVPLGISFFSFQQISYIVDCYKGSTHIIGILDYICFVSFFPQILSGPISRFWQLAPQLENLKGISYKNFAVGIMIFSIGLVKKGVFADYCGEIADPIFNASLDNSIVLSCSEAWEAAIGYTLQLYFDFSGYCDMAVGCAKILGITLPVNFDSPYKSKSIVEFWRRWHMSLSFFLRDYLYIPLGGNKHGYSRKCCNLLTTMLLGGLWHGAAWTFVVWGGLHGLMLVINNIFKDFLKHINLSSIRDFFAYKMVAWLITFVCVSIAWVFFRAETFSSAWEIVSGMFSPSLGFSENRFFDVNNTTLCGVDIGLGFQQFAMIALLLICIFAKNSVQIQERIEKSDSSSFKFNMYLGACMFVIMMVSLIIIGRSSNSSFIYFNF